MLTTLRQPGRRLAVVFGAGGDRDPGKRAPMGEVAAELADLVVVTDDNPRSEDPAAIRREILAGAAKPAARRRWSRSATGARRSGTRSAGRAPVTWCVIAGKGHETGQRGAAEVRPFDDRVELARGAWQACEARAMIDLTVAQIAEIVGGTLADISPEAAAQRHVTGTVEFDSRAVGPGGLFLALPGARSDGHDHAAVGGRGRRGRRAGRPAGRGPRHRGAPPRAGATTAGPGCSSMTPTGRARRCWPRWPSWPRRWPPSWWPAG